MTHWVPYSVSQGYAGLAVLWGYLDSCFRDEGWDVSGREQLELAVRSAEEAPELPLGLFSGLSGLAFGAWQLSDKGLVTAIAWARLTMRYALERSAPANKLQCFLPRGTVGDFDVISGASGVGAYLFCRRDQPGPAPRFPP